MDYHFKKSKSRELQEWIVAKIRAVLPNENIQIFSRLKGDIASDIEESLARVGLAVVVSPYLVQDYADRVVGIVAENGLIAVSVVENVTTNDLKKDDVEIHADNLLECVVHAIYNERFEGSIPQFQPLEDASPENEPVMILVQKIKFQVNF